MKSIHRLISSTSARSFFAMRERESVRPAVAMAITRSRLRNSPR